MLHTAQDLLFTRVLETLISFEAVYCKLFPNYQSMPTAGCAAE